jgi:hypothetical protein
MRWTVRRESLQPARARWAATKASPGNPARVREAADRGIRLVPARAEDVGGPHESSQGQGVEIAPSHRGTEEAVEVGVGAAQIHIALAHAATHPEEIEAAFTAGDQALQQIERDRVDSTSAAWRTRSDAATRGRGARMG